MRNEDIKVVVKSLQRIKQSVCHHMTKTSDMCISPSEWTILHLINDSNIEGIMAKDLALRLGITTSAVSQLLKQMETSGYIKRVTDKKDRRATLIRGTEKSKKALKKLDVAVTNSVAKLFDHLSDREIGQLANLHQKINN